MGQGAAMKPVFISYSRDDSDFVNRLRDDLSANGVDVWLDKTGLKAAVFLLKIGSFHGIFQ